MDKNIHFVNTTEYYNEEFRIYDIAYLSNNIFLSSDIIGQLIYYEISENSINFDKKDVMNIYPLDDLDNLISIFSIDTLNNDNIILGSSNGEIVYLKNKIISEKYSNLKSEKISKVKFISENIFASGDFKGCITLFDKRQKSPIKIFKEQTEEITDILFEPNRPNFLLSSSIDSTLCVYDINKLSLYALSDKLDEDLNCMLSFKNGNHILCGSEEGNILIFNWDWFGDFKDMIKGHPEGINDMDKYDENIFFTGTEDGFIRICTMYPKGIRGVLKNKNKNNEKNKIKDVNKIKISQDKKNVIACSGIDCLRMFDISQIEFDKIYKPIDDLDSQDEIENNNDDDNKLSSEDNESEDNNDNKNEKKKKDIKEKEEKDVENEEEEEDEEENEEEEDFEDKEEREGEELEDEEGNVEEEGEEEEEEEEEEKENEGKIKKEKPKEEENSDFNFSDSDNDNQLKDNKLLNKKRKKIEKEEDFSSEEGKDEDEINNKKEYSNSDSDSDSDDSSSTKKKRSKKVKKIGKKTKSLIAKEERKAFFNDL